MYLSQSAFIFYICEISGSKSFLSGEVFRRVCDERIEFRVSEFVTSVQALKGCQQVEFGVGRGWPGGYEYTQIRLFDVE